MREIFILKNFKYIRTVVINLNIFNHSHFFQKILKIVFIFKKKSKFTLSAIKMENKLKTYVHRMIAHGFISIFYLKHKKRV